MKILYLISSSKWTGPAVPMVQFCKELKEQGIDIEIGCIQNPTSKKMKPDSRYLLANRIRECKIPLQVNLNLNRKTISLDWWRDFQTLKKLKGQYDLVHCNLNHDLTLAMLAGWGKEKKVVYTHHSSKPWRNDPWHIFLLNRISLLVVRSQNAKQDFIKNFFFPQEKIFVLPPALDEIPQNLERESKRNELGFNSDGIVIGMAARMQPKRDHSTFLKAAALLKDSYSNLKFLLVGTGESRSDIEEEIENLGLKEIVLLAGFRENDYWDVINCMDIKVLTAPGSDVSCRAVLEAMSLGIPVVGARTQVFPDLLEPDLLFEPGNSKSLAEVLIPLIEDSTKRLETGKSLKEKIQKEFNLKIQTQNLIAKYKNL